MHIHLLKIKRIAGALLGIAIAIAALVILRRHTENITVLMVKNALKEIPPHHIMLCAMGTLVSFMAIAAGEIIAVKSLGDKKLALRIPILAGAVGNALGNTLGFHAITVTAWRYKIYFPENLSFSNIARITTIGFIGVFLSFLGVITYSFLLDPDSQWHVAGALLVAGLVGTLIWIGKKPRYLCFKSHSIYLPGVKLITMQLVMGVVDISAAIYACYSLLPAELTINYPHFAGIYVGAVLFGIASHVPGGIGIFEAGILTALAANGRAEVIAELLLYRLIYNLIPFFLSSIVVLARFIRSISVR